MQQGLCEQQVKKKDKGGRDRGGSEGAEDTDQPEGPRKLLPCSIIAAFV